jgi:hypothetical protein
MCLFLWPPKPPRLRIAKMGTKAKIRWKGPAQQRHLLLRFLKILALTGRGNVSKSSLFSSASVHKTVAGETLDIEDDEELFDALDS